MASRTNNAAAKDPKKWQKVVLASLVIVAWFLVAGIGGPYFGKISDVSSTDLTTFLPKSAESTKVNDRLKEFQNTKSIPAIIVFSKQDKTLSVSDIAAIQKLNTTLGTVKGVQKGVSPPIVSKDGKAAFTVVPLASDGDFKTIFPALKGVVAKANLSTSYALTGPASFAYDLQGAFSGIDGTLLLVALCVVFVILLVVYRSPLLPLIVLFTAMAALAAAILVVYYLAKANIVQLNGQVQGILFILVIGATTDYSLLYTARFREELVHYPQAWKAAAVALRRSLEPIIAAGGTVTVGLLCLLFSDLGSNKALGPVGGIGIILSIISALTLLPAVLSLFGRAAFWPRRPKYSASASDQSYGRNHPLWARIGRFVHRRSRWIWISGILVLFVACGGILQLKANGVAQSDLIIGKSEARDGQHILDGHFPSGSGSPAYIVAHHDKQAAVVRALESDKGVSSVSITTSGSSSGAAPVVFGGSAAKVVDGTILLQATLTNPADSFAARDTIVRLRNEVKSVDSSALVGGTTAAQYDTNQAALRDEHLIIPLILGAITVILMLLLRSVVAPLVLLLTTVLSFGATLGISALLFNHLWHFPGGDPAVVIFGFVFLVALGIDYNIFLMTRVREETKKSGTNRGAIKGLVVTGGVITSAGVVLAATFAALSVIPILFLVQIAFIVAFGVLLDTVLVRSLIVPALTLEIGRFMWWPSRLYKKTYYDNDLLK